eukprot:GHVR01129168.1.p1 GENE.GHVR01129168.1~~GHVR01129168.1.p1  ORF type:complete len:138 (+),score=32.48 GHVR01129168.1:58-414(+)
MNQQNANRRLRLANQELAEAQKFRQICLAQGESDSTFLQGSGISRKRQAIVEGMKETIDEFSTHLKEFKPQDVLDLILISQYFDTLKELANPGASTVVFTNKRSQKDLQGSLNKIMGR